VVLLCTSLGPGAQQGERRLGRNTGNSPEKRPGRNTGNPLGGNLAVTQVTAWGKPGRNTGESLGGGDTWQEHRYLNGEENRQEH
jgi:hypothetical protein